MNSLPVVRIQISDLSSRIPLKSVPPGATPVLKR
jgi:hypothetical protein